MKEIKELSKCGDVPYLCTGRLNIVKMSFLLSLIYRFKAISVKIPASYCVDIDKLILKFITKRPRIANTILREKNEIGGLTLLNFETYYKATVIKTLVLLEEQIAR